MEAQQLLALGLLVFVYALSATRWLHRAAAALVGAVVAGVTWGLPSVIGSILPEVLLVTAGLMVVAGAVRRSGLASWFALRAAKLAHGSPSRILVLTGLLTWILGALLGPIAAVAMVVPVTLLLAVELDVPALPFVVVLSWTSLLGAVTTLTALPGNLWLGSLLHVDGLSWAARMIPYTGMALVLTLAVGLVVFRKRLRVTNERRARVLEYDARQSLEDGGLVARTAVVLVLVGTGFAAGSLVGLSPALVAVAGALLIWLAELPQSTDRLVGDLDAGTLLFFAGVMAVVGTVSASGLLSTLSSNGLAPVGLLWLSAGLSVFLDHGAVVGLLGSWAAQGMGQSIPTWPMIAMGSALGAGTTILGSLAGATAIGLTGQGARKVDWRAFSGYGLLFALFNLAAVTALAVVLG